MGLICHSVFVSFCCSANGVVEVFYVKEKRFNGFASLMSFLFANSFFLVSLKWISCSSNFLSFWCSHFLLKIIKRGLMRNLVAELWKGAKHNLDVAKFVSTSPHPSAIHLINRKYHVCFTWHDTWNHHNP